MSVDYIVYFLLLIVAIGTCWRQNSRLALADKFIGVLLLFTLATEIAAYTAKEIWNNNMVVFHVYNPIEFLLLSLYFNYSIRVFRRYNIGFILGAFGIVLAALNTMYLQKPSGINSYFMLFEGTIIIMYCLLSFHQLILDEQHLPYSFVNFWIALFLILYWGLTFTGWGVYGLLSDASFELNKVLMYVLRISNHIFYAGLTTVFLRYKKLIPSGHDG